MSADFLITLIKYSLFVRNKYIAYVSALNLPNVQFILNVYENWEYFRGSGKLFAQTWRHTERVCCLLNKGEYSGGFEL